MAANHPGQPWTPISVAMMRDVEGKFELAAMLLKKPHVQFDGPPFNSADGSTSTVDVPWSAKVRKLMKSDIVVCKMWERITNQLL